jgi:uncharacterized membrane protein
MERVAHERSSSFEREHVSPEQVERSDRGSIADILLALGGTGLTTFGLMRRGSGGLILAAAGATLGAVGLRRLGNRWRGHSASALGTVTIDAPRDEVFGMWRNVVNLPRFMRHVVQVDDLGNGRSHWRVRMSPNMPELEWDAEIVEQRPDELVAWRTINGAILDHEHRVWLVDAPGGRGTEVHARVTYRPRAGTVGSAASRLISPAVGHELRADLRRLKQLMETGEIPTARAPGPSGGAT